MQGRLAWAPDRLLSWLHEPDVLGAALVLHCKEDLCCSRKASLTCKGRDSASQELITRPAC